MFNDGAKITSYALTSKNKVVFLRMNSSLGSNCQVVALRELDFVPEMLFGEAKCCREIEFCFLKILMLHVLGTGSRLCFEEVVI